MTEVSLAAVPPDPTWRKALCWPEGATTYVIWEATDENEAVPPNVRVVIAEALCDLGSIVFLGGPGNPMANEWRRVDGVWVGASKKLLDWILFKPGFRFTVSRSSSDVETLFEQQGFDWHLRGQAAFVLESDISMQPMGSPDSFAACLEFNPPQHPPQGCIAILRPGTDGDLAEFHAVSRKVIKSFAGHFSVPQE